MDRLFARLQHRKLVIRGKISSFHKGMRKARQPGSTLEFSDYRLYQYGDDIRQIDWNVYGRTGKYYIKRFLDEKEITVAIYLDCSQSMQVYPEKWQLAKQLAAGFSFIALVHNDRLSFIPVKEDSQIATRKGPAYARAMFRDISELSGTIDGEPFTFKCKKTLLKNCDLAIVISDGLEPIENWGEFFKRFAGAHKAVRFLQILARKELEPDFTGDISLIDIETEQEVNVTITEKLTAMYQERLLMHNEKLSRLCRKYGCSYMSVDTKDNLEEILLQKCMQYGWLE